MYGKYTVELQFLGSKNVHCEVFWHIRHLEFYHSGWEAEMIIRADNDILSPYLGSYAMGELVRNLPSRQQRSAKNLEEDTVVAVLNTIHEIITDSSENARSLIQTQGIQKLVAISKSR